MSLNDFGNMLDSTIPHMSKCCVLFYILSSFKVTIMYISISPAILTCHNVLPFFEIFLEPFKNISSINKSFVYSLPPISIGYTTNTHQNLRLYHVYKS